MKNQELENLDPGSTPGASTIQNQRNQIVNPYNSVPNSFCKNGGYIYVLSSPKYDFVKIGFTKQPPRSRAVQFSYREKEHEKFKVEYSGYVENARMVERSAHKYFKAKHVRREFYKVTPIDVKNFIESNYRAIDRVERIRQLMCGC